EDAAKDNDKNSIALFDIKYTFNFDYFIDNVYNSKLSYIKEFFENQPEQGKTFIYRLLDLIYNRDTKDRISFARIAYTLAKAEESIPKEKRKEFIDFKSKMLNWFEDEKEILSTELALMLYIYQIRKDR
ncbi:MAG TPA: type III-A CRISPR-associated protein Cas10/Csm1, partial [Candidatus Coprovivens excrementavium]|nr:type III-A CRISPR-associated protein Cas10/Csm1 [Candidatus Coprovivens excrementavium]